MTKLRPYYLWFFALCFALTLIVGVIAAFLPASLGGVLTAAPYLVAMIVVLYKFIKQQRRAPTVQEKKKLTLGFTLIFWGYNLCGFLFGLFLFARKDPQVMQAFVTYFSNPQFIALSLVMVLVLAIPLYLISYWFYGKQAQRMADKILN